MSEADKQIENANAPAAASGAEATALPQVQNAPPKPKHRTVGNIIYDFGVYTTFAWGGVELASLFSAHEAMHGKNKYFNWLRSLNDNCISGLSKFLSKGILKGKPKDVIHGWAKGSTMFVTLGLGGWAMMAPIKWLEDNRQRNAARIDNVLGTTPPDPETIEKEPKQTWHSVLSGRLFSWGVSYLAFLAMGPKLTGKLNDKIGDTAAGAWMKMRPASNPASVKKWANIGAFDALFTVITAAVTYVWSRHIAKEDEEEYTAEHPQPVILPVTPSQEEKRYAEAHKPREKSSIARPDALYTDKIAKNQHPEAQPSMV